MDNHPRHKGIAKELKDAGITPYYWLPIVEISMGSIICGRGYGSGICIACSSRPYRSSKPLSDRSSATSPALRNGSSHAWPNRMISTWKYVEHPGKKAGRATRKRGKSKLDGKEEGIKRFLALKVSKASIAKITGVDRSTLYHFIRSRQLD